MPRSFRSLCCLIALIATPLLAVAQGLPGVGAALSPAAQAAVVPTAERGVIDLRGTDLSKGGVTLDGEWELFWRRLLTPSDTAYSPTALVQFPALWKNTIVDGVPLPSTGFASYRLTVLLPPHKNRLAMVLPNTYASFRLFVNGEEFGHSGSPGTSPETTTPKWIEQTLEIPGNADTLQLILQIANFVHSKGGSYKHLQIGDKDFLFHERVRDIAFDLTLAGCLFMGGLFFFGLYLFGEQDRATLYFALFSATYAYRVVGSRLYALHSVFPDIPWAITTHVEYLTLFLSVAFFSLYTKHLFPKDTGKFVLRANIAICLALAAIVIFFPPQLFTQLITPFLLVMFSVIVFAFTVYIRAVRNRRIGSGYALASTGVLLVNWAVINLEYFGLVAPQKALLFSGYVAFFFLQSLILSFRFANALTRAKQAAELALVAKSDFMSTMSHEIRTPLNSILGMTHLMLREAPGEQQKEQLNVLLYSSTNLMVIVNDILDYNKIEAGKVAFESLPVDLASTARQIVAGLQPSADDKAIELRLHVDPALRSLVLADPTRIAQVLTNLLSNAIKFTNRGRVSLELLVVGENEESITVNVRVEDSGIGIPKDKQQVIFEQFAQADSSTSRRFGGTGLGLAICKRLLRLQGADLQLESEPGKGSIFHYTQQFPKAGTSVEIEPMASAYASEVGHPLSGVSILLVEDNEVNILVAKMFLQRWGAQVDVARNGAEALALLDVNRHTLVLMDMHMSVMDGYEATRRMRANGVRLPIVALTASLPDDVDDRLKNVGLDDLVLKPFIPEELFRIVNHYTATGADGALHRGERWTNRKPDRRNRVGAQGSAQ